ncbi:unnamed protein product [Hymenolepis diminuta]|uniref:DUF5727 domain-containing protein n=1 Tax=Hymenolepis diminuta TaxID=6216 RepID=A0A564XYL3_HYMDI|nr:unnamed protein product [Hymenolepis diminuta]
MTFEWTSMQKPVILTDHTSAIYIKDGKCIVDGSEVGSQCSNQSDGRQLEIMLNDVTITKSLAMSTDFEQISLTHFVPYCDFEQPKDGVVDLETSFPFSRFVGGEQYIQLKFAVGGAKYNGQVKNALLLLVKHIKIIFYFW